MGLEQIIMPQLGESVTEGTIINWLIKEGSTVKKYEPIAEVMTDKVTAEVPSSFAGTIKQIIANAGDTIKVGEVICTIETKEKNDVHLAKVSEEIRKNDAEQKMISPQKQRYSPAVLKLSQEYGIDLRTVQGTGKGGRITRKDILQRIKENKNMKKDVQITQSAPVIVPAIESSKVMETHKDTIIPVTPLRQVIANNMVKAKQEIPHAWMMVEVDVTNLVEFRNGIKDEFKQKEGFPITYFSFFVKAVAQALKEFPQLNSTWQGKEIIQKKAINLAIAVAADHALYVPVIKAADEKTIKGIAREIAELAEKARSGKLKQEDIEGGTFTVNNTGAFGSVQSMGIINYPQAAILQVETIVKRPVVMENGMIAVRDMVNLCLSIDHRVLDGLIAGRFLQRLKEILENVSKENTPIY